MALSGFIGRSILLAMICWQCIWLGNITRLQLFIFFIFFLLYWLLFVCFITLHCFLSKNENFVVLCVCQTHLMTCWLRYLVIPKYLPAGNSICYPLDFSWLGKSSPDVLRKCERKLPFEVAEFNKITQY